MAHPIAETSAPIEPALSPIRVTSSKGLNITYFHFLNLKGSQRW